MYQTLKLLQAKEPVNKLKHRKSVLDTATFCTLIAAVYFLFAKIQNTEVSYERSRLYWGLTFYSVPITLILGGIPEIIDASKTKGR